MSLALLAICQPAWSQGPCQLVVINHVYTVQSGEWSQKLPYQKQLLCEGEFNLLDNPGLLKQVEVKDTVYEDVTIDLTRVDVEVESQQVIIDLLVNYMEYLSLKSKENGQTGIAYFPWKVMFKDFGLLEGRSISGRHPKDQSVPVVISFHNISRIDVVGRAEEILDLAGNPCGEIFYDEQGNELFRYYFVAGWQGDYRKLKFTYLPAFLIGS
ncbi:MAG: hypothetical protein KatS3mg030_556 [Saprospiraceae bacterium]|nr:MAG: hypothetical protein KatS3mg030_556 [Saprospiraceae bacterium]